MNSIDELKTLENSIKTVLEEVAEAGSFQDENNQLIKLSQIRLKLDPQILWDADSDPFSESYREGILSLYGYISGKNNYFPKINETTDAFGQLSSYDQPLPYRFNNSDLLAQHLGAYSWIIFNLDVHQNDHVLEYGSGEGQLSLSLARFGCQMYAIDIEERFLKFIEKQAENVGVKINTKQGEFGEHFEGVEFDRVIFFEAFHHWFLHTEGLRKIRTFLKSDGFICFAGEPIISSVAPAEHRDIIPYPWGLRLDGESIRSINEFGWMELGFTQDYFVDLCIRSGFSVEFSPSPLHWRGDCYIARPIGERFPIESDILIKTYSGHSGWHKWEGSHRWTDGHAYLPIPQIGYKNVSILVQNLSHKQIDARMFTEVDMRTLSIKSGESALIEVPVNSNARYLQIVSPSFIPSEVFSESKDRRNLGLAVKSIMFR